MTTNTATNTTNAASPPPAIDMSDPTFWRDRQHEAWTWCRANEPVYRDANSGFVAVTRHADVLHVERHPQTFSSAGTYRVNETPLENSMIAQDDPGHLRQRRLVNRRFTPRAVRDRSAELETIECELVDAIAGQLPARFTCDLLGIPEDEWRTVKSWSERFMRIDSIMSDPHAMEGLTTASQELITTLLEMVPRERACPVGPGLISQWSHAELEGEPFEMDRIFNEVGLFVAGGAETTRTAIAHGLRTFCDHPDQWELLHDEPERIPVAVDEVIRWVTPLNNMHRKATVDTEVGGTPIAAGERLALVYPSANRDEAVFDDPFTFDVRRDPNPHLSFGIGTHFCIGANYARHELEILFRKLSREWTDLHVVEEIDVEANIFAPAVRSFRIGYTAR